MLVIPAVDIREGKCVQLVGGKPDTGKEYGDPVKAALDWEKREATCVHVIDLDAAMGDGENMDKVTEIVENVSIGVQVGGGIRTLERGDELLEIGADRIILGTVAFKSPEILRDLIKKFGSERVMVALDVKEGKIAVEGWKEKTERNLIETAKEFEKMGVNRFLFTNIDVEGKMVGLDTQTLEQLVDSVESSIFVAGGVKSLEDVKKAKEVGASAIVIGTALYEGEINFERAFEVAE